MSKQNTKLIPREIFFGNPQRISPRISPDGRQIAYLGPRNGVMNIWVAAVDDLAGAIPVTDDRTTGISQYSWAYTNRHILYLQDDNGDEDYHLYAVNLPERTADDLTPLQGISARVIQTHPDFPGQVLVGINDRGEHHFHDVYQIDIETGERTLIVENPGFAGFLADHQFRVRLAIAFTPQAELQMYLADSTVEGGWKPLITVTTEDILTTRPGGFDQSGDVLYLIDSRGRDTAAFKTLTLSTNELREIFASDRADVNALIQHPTQHTVQAVAYNYLRPEWKILDESIREDIEVLREVERGDLDITSRSIDDQTWTVAFDSDNAPVKFFLYDRQAKRATFLFSHRPELENLPLAPMHPMVIPARDGLPLVSYLTLPKAEDPSGKARPDQPLPMVLLVHGGPWHRDEWGFDPLHQLLANRGYAVLSVNFRGSTGFGKRFINAANREWAQRMHDDLLDAVDWAVTEKIADRQRIAIMGGSYGGYATLVGLTFTPEIFACGVDLVGPSSLISMLENPPPYWMPIMPIMQDRVGDWTTEEGREFLKSRSPLYRSDAIRRPLLIGQGAKDPRVKQAESDQIVAAMQAKGIPVIYMLYPEEGHGFDRPENNLSFFAVTELFLAQHLGGRTEALDSAFQGANFTIPAGREQIPPVEKALKQLDG